VVGYSEGSHLATPQIIDESIRITRQALYSYRLLKVKGNVNDMSKHPDVEERKTFLVKGAKEVLRTIEYCIKNPYTSQGFQNGFSSCAPVTVLQGGISRSSEMANQNKKWRC
jgi:hypothetical protein